VRIWITHVQKKSFLSLRETSSSEKVLFESEGDRSGLVEWRSTALTDPQVTALCRCNERDKERIDGSHQKNLLHSEDDRRDTRTHLFVSSVYTKSELCCSAITNRPADC